MSIINGYVTRDDFLSWVTPQDKTSNIIDDSVIDDIIESASRYFDDETERTFYPRVETRSYDVPESRELIVDDDLLSVITLTNGDDSEIESTEYNLFPKNITPHIGLKLKSTSSIYWTLSSGGESEWVIDLLGEWGFHNRYEQRAWASGGTLGAVIDDTTTLAFTMTADHSIQKHQIVKIDNEIYIVDIVKSNAITPLARGDNGSTAATHEDGATVYIWKTQRNVAKATKLIAQSLYRRFGKPNQSDESIVTASGVIITPKDVPGIAARVISLCRKRI